MSTKKIIYHLAVYVSMPLADDDDAENVDFHTYKSATTPAVKRQIERHIFNVLKRSDYDCDVELMEFSVENK